MRQVELFYFPQEACQTRWQQLFNDFGPVAGKQPDKPSYVSKHLANEIHFDEDSGASMFCVSSCSETDLGSCNRQERKGICVGDSGCKCIGKNKSVWITLQHIIWLLNTDNMLCFIGLPLSIVVAIVVFTSGTVAFLHVILQRHVRFPDSGSKVYWKLDK